MKVKKQKQQLTVSRSSIISFVHFIRFALLSAHYLRTSTLLPMPKSFNKEDKPKIGDLVETNPNVQRIKQACMEHVSAFEASNEPLLTWPQPKSFAEQYGFRNFNSESFRTAYYKIRSQVEGKLLEMIFLFSDQHSKFGILTNLYQVKKILIRKESKKKMS